MLHPQPKPLALQQGCLKRPLECLIKLLAGNSEALQTAQHANSLGSETEVTTCTESLLGAETFSVFTLSKYNV